MKAPWRSAPKTRVAGLACSVVLCCVLLAWWCVTQEPDSEQTPCASDRPSRSRPVDCPAPEGSGGPSRPTAPSLSLESRETGLVRLRVVRPRPGQECVGLAVNFAVSVTTALDRRLIEVTVDGVRASLCADGLYRVWRSFPRAGPLRSEVRCAVEPDIAVYYAAIEYSVRRSVEQDAAYEALERTIAELDRDATLSHLGPLLNSRDVRLGRSVSRLLLVCRNANARYMLVGWVRRYSVVDAVPALAHLLGDDDLAVCYLARRTLASIVGKGLTGDLLASHEAAGSIPSEVELLDTFAIEEEHIRERLSQPRSW